jgi:uncharacterized membrane protein
VVDDNRDSADSASDVLRLLRQYRVEYVFVGSLEREKYGPAVAQRFGQLLNPVFEGDGAVVYAVPLEEPA